MKKVLLILAVAGLFTITACKSKPAETPATEPTQTEATVETPVATEEEAPATTEEAPATTEEAPKK